MSHKNLMAENEFLLDDKERYIDNTRWRCPYEYKRILEKQHLGNCETR